MKPLNLYQWSACTLAPDDTLQMPPSKLHECEPLNSHKSLKDYPTFPQNLTFLHSTS